MTDYKEYDFVVNDRSEFTIYLDVQICSMNFIVHRDEFIFVEGMIKWDGCMEVKGSHFCGWLDVQDYTVLIKHLFEDAADKIPNWDSDVADY